MRFEGGCSACMTFFNNDSSLPPAGPPIDMLNEAEEGEEGVEESECWCLAVKIFFFFFGRGVAVEVVVVIEDVEDSCLFNWIFTTPWSAAAAEEGGEGEEAVLLAAETAAGAPTAAGAVVAAEDVDIAVAGVCCCCCELLCFIFILSFPPLELVVEEVEEAGEAGSDDDEHDDCGWWGVASLTGGDPGMDINAACGSLLLCGCCCWSVVVETASIVILRSKRIKFEYFSDQFVEFFSLATGAD